MAVRLVMKAVLPSKAAGDWRLQWCFHSSVNRSVDRLVPQPPLHCTPATLWAAIRLFYWCRLAYRGDEALDYKHVNIKHALALFELDQVRWSGFVILCAL